MLRKVVTGILVVSFSIIAYAYQTAFMSVQTPESVIIDANEALRLQVSSILEQRARALGLALDTSDMVYICRDDFIMINAGVAGFENGDSSAGMIALGLAMIYVSQEVNVRFGDGNLGTRLPAGFYTVRATVSQSSTAHDPGITLLEIFDSSERSMIEYQATTLPSSDERTLTASLGVRSVAEVKTDDVACFGWVTQQFGCEMCVVLGRDM